MKQVIIWGWVAFFAFMYTYTVPISKPAITLLLWVIGSAIVISVWERMEK